MYALIFVFMRDGYHNVLITSLQNSLKEYEEVGVPMIVLQDSSIERLVSAAKERMRNKNFRNMVGYADTDTRVLLGLEF